MGRLEGKVALITGGSAGIGFAIAQRFAREGARVIITGRRLAELEQAAATIGASATIAPGDLTVTADRTRAFETVGSVFGKLDILVANAGLLEPGTLEETDAADFDRTFDLNVRSVLLTVQAASPLLTDGGAIVLIGSIATTLGTAGYGSYAASKAAIRSYSRTWASEFAERRIRVNTLSPGPIQTAMYDRLAEDVRSGLTAAIPLGRAGTPEEVAAAALFLASDDSSFVTGIELFVDGGLTQV